MNRIFMCPVLLVGAMAMHADDCVVVTGAQILASDLAKADPLFAQLQPDLVIAPSPVPGIRRVMSSSELRRVARRHELPDVSAKSVCFEQVMSLLTEGRVLDALNKALGDPRSSIEVIEFSKFPVPKGELEFKRSGLNIAAGSRVDTPVLWRGLLHYGERRSLSVWARVRIRVSRRQVVASRDLPVGKTLAEGDLREQSVDGLPVADKPLESLQEAAGAVPRRRIRRGEVLYASMLRVPSEVQRGDLVNVEVVSGSARLQFEAKAETEGSHGTPVMVKNPTTGRRFTAVVESKGRVAVRTR